MDTLSYKTLSSNKISAEKKWFIVDAEGQTLGRFSSKIAKILRGKYKTNFTPHADCGDNVVIVNAEKVKLTGNKLEDKVYYRHTGYPGGIKSITAKKVLEGKNPDRLVRLAVKRMIPSGPLGRKQLSNMKVYIGSNHPHEAQNPKALNIKELI